MVLYTRNFEICLNLVFHFDNKVLHGPKLRKNGPRFVYQIRVDKIVVTEALMCKLRNYLKNEIDPTVHFDAFPLTVYSLV